MSDLISRQAAIERIEKQKYREPSIGVWKQNDRVALVCYDTVIEALKRLPSVEPNKGKWIKISPANIYECSVCHQNVMTEDIEAYLFCHHCGADMRESE